MEGRKWRQVGRRRGGRVENGHFLGTERNESARCDSVRSDVRLIVRLIRVECTLSCPLCLGCNVNRERCRNDSVCSGFCRLCEREHQETGNWAVDSELSI